MSLATLTQLADFDTVIDARSPAEFVDDHLPGAISCPVLDDAERAEVGTLYKQVSPFDARKLGAVLVARNIARHVEQLFADKPRDWRPLVYCWRGGQRSGAFTHVLREIGWKAARLAGGYKTWRAHVIESNEALPARLRFEVIAGPTGSAKSRLLDALAEAGEQVLHLERLAAHKGSVLGDLPGEPQPSQRRFESLLCAAMQGFDPARPVFVESESRRIGRVHLPGALIERMRAAPCHVVDAPAAVRARYLVTDYDYATADTAWLLARLDALRELHSRETLAHWQALVEGRAFNALATELLERHYDPLYRRSQRENFAQASAHPPLLASTLDADGIAALAAAVRIRAVPPPL